MKRISVLIILVAGVAALGLIFAGSHVMAQDLGYGDPKPQPTESKWSGVTASASSRGSTRAMSHDGLSPFPTPQPTDTKFVVDTSPGELDTPCQYRSQGSIKFNIQVTRYVGPVNGQGKLLNAQSLINNKIISPTAKLTMPAKDVDYNAITSPPHQPERDRIFVNGEPIGDLGSDGYLDGENDQWRMNELTIKIDKLRFAQLNDNAPPTPGVNEIEILIDQGNIANNIDLWCTSIDWAALEFKALDPIIMIHGNGSSHAFWTNERFVLPFLQTGTPHDATIDLPTTFVRDNARTLLTEKIPPIAAKFGVKHVHLVCHSKGGLDTRAFLKLLPVVDPPVAIMSVTTLSTPHHGSALADYIRDVQGANVNTSQNEERVKLIQKYGGALDNGRRNLLTDWVAGFNKENLPLPTMFTVDGEEYGVNYFAFYADANANESFDSDGEPTIQFHELVGTGLGAVVGHIFTGGGTTLYRTLYHVASTYEGKDAQGRKIVLEVQNGQVGLPLQPNDMLVTKHSAQPYWFMALAPVKKNHATVGDEEMGNKVLELIRSIRPLEW